MNPDPVNVSVNVEHPAVAEAQRSGSPGGRTQVVTYQYSRMPPAAPAKENGLGTPQLVFRIPAQLRVRVEARAEQEGRPRIGACARGARALSGRLTVLAEPEPVVPGEQARQKSHLARPDHRQVQSSSHSVSLKVLSDHTGQILIKE